MQLRYDDMWKFTCCMPVHINNHVYCNVKISNFRSSIIHGVIWQARHIHKLSRKHVCIHWHFRMLCHRDSHTDYLCVVSIANIEYATVIDDNWIFYGPQAHWWQTVLTLHKMHVVFCCSHLERYTTWFIMHNMKGQVWEEDMERWENYKQCTPLLKTVVYRSGKLTNTDCNVKTTNMPHNELAIILSYCTICKWTMLLLISTIRKVC